MSNDDDVRRVAAFDFDGTITERDTLAGFLHLLSGSRGFARVVLTHSPRLVGGLRDDVRRDAAKAAVLGAVLGGRAHGDVAEAGERYARRLPARFRPDVIERVEWHRSEGHELVMVSASLVYYLRPVAAELGFEDVIAVEIEVGDDGRLTRSLVGPNVRAAEKERRLREWLARDADGRTVELWAYGNSSGDDQLLAMSDHPTWIGKRATDRR